MSSDIGEREPEAPKPRHELPTVVGVTTRRVSLRRRTRNFESVVPSEGDAVEFLVETAEPIPIRALGPVLYVGNVPLTEVTAEDPTHYRFVGHQPHTLDAGAPLSLGWSGRPGERQETAHLYEG